MERFLVHQRFPQCGDVGHTFLLLVQGAVHCSSIGGDQSGRNGWQWCRTWWTDGRSRCHRAQTIEDQHDWDNGKERTHTEGHAVGWHCETNCVKIWIQIGIWSSNFLSKTFCCWTINKSCFSNLELVRNEWNVDFKLIRMLVLNLRHTPSDESERKSEWIRWWRVCVISNIRKFVWWKRVWVERIDACRGELTQRVEVERETANEGYTQLCPLQWSERNQHQMQKNKNPERVERKVMMNDTRPDYPEPLSSRSSRWWWS